MCLSPDEPRSIRGDTSVHGVADDLRRSAPEAQRPSHPRRNRAAPAAASGADALTAELRAGLRVAADAGDIMALRTALRAARERQPSASSFIDQLEKLAAGYQLERIRQLLNDPPGP